MKLFLSISIVLIILQPLYSQTQKETEGWIESKIEYYAPSYKSSYNAYFEDCHLVIEGTLFGDQIDYRIPIKDLMYVKKEKNENNQTSIILNFKTINMKKSIYIRYPGKSEASKIGEYTNNVPLVLDIGFIEDDLSERMNNAFNHLIKICGGRVVEEKF